MSQSEDYLSKNLEALENETNKEAIDETVEDRDEADHQPEQDRIEEALKEAVEGQPVVARNTEPSHEYTDLSSGGAEDDHSAHFPEEAEQELDETEQPLDMANELSGLEHRQETGLQDNVSESHVSESQMPGENSADRLLDRINKQKDIVARDLDEDTEDTKSRALSDTMEQAWQHVDQNVQRLTGNENQPVYHPPQSFHRYLPPHDYAAQENLTAWNSTPEQIGGRALMVPQLNLAEQIQMPEMLNKQGFVPPQIPKMGEWQETNTDIIQGGEIFDRQGNPIHDPIYTASDPQPGKSRKQAGSRFLGFGAVLGVIGAGSIYYYGGVDNLKSDFERIAGVERVVDTKDNERLDLAQQTIKSEAKPESRGTAVKATLGGKSEIAAHDAAIEAKLRGDDKYDAPGDMQPNLLAAAVKSGQAAQPKFKFAIDNITGPAGRNLALNINLTEKQKAATTNLVFYGVPGEIKMSVGERAGRTWIVPRAELNKLSLISDPEFQGPVDLEVELQNSNTSISERAKLAVNIGPFSETIVAEAGETRNVIRGTSVVVANQVNKPNNQQAVLGENAKSLANVKPVRSQPKRISPALESGLLKRGKDFMSVGDFASARLAFEHLAASGHAGGAVALAETFDPQFLVANEARGLQGDIEQALKWYRHAVSLGHEEAMSRVRELELELQ